MSQQLVTTLGYLYRAPLHLPFSLLPNLIRVVAGGSRSGQKNTRDRNIELNILTEFEKGHCGEPSCVPGAAHAQGLEDNPTGRDCVHLQKSQQPDAYLPFLSQSRFQIFNFGFIP